MFSKLSYTLTRPKTLTGETTEFFKTLKVMTDGRQVSAKEYKQINMTYQALRENNLIKAENRKGYVITAKGRAYVKYVDSTNCPLKSILKSLMGAS